MAARFSIDGKIYATSALDEVPLRDLIRFNTEAADMGLRERWNDIQNAAVEMDGMTAKDAENHPDSLLVMAVTIWVSRRLAGEDLVFGDAVNVPMKAIKFLDDPEDRKPGPTKGAKSRPKASAVAARPTVLVDEPTTLPTSEPKSSTASSN